MTLWLMLASAAIAGASSAAPAVAQDSPAPAAAAEAAEAPLDPAAAKAREKQLRALKRQYGLGPYPEEIDGFVGTRQETLRPFYRALYTGGERNAVLNLSRLGLAAMELSQWTDAERAFDAALLRIESVFAQNKQAEAARSLWHKESNKEWKGEPYERSMAYYYRGLLYLRKGDYNNARAAFKGAEYQDTVSDAEEFKSDFALMNYLIGWSAKCAGDSGASDFDAAAAAQTDLTPPAAGDNVLLIAELGHGPVKAKDGKMREKLVFNAADGFPETGAIFTLAPARGTSRAINGRVASSVYYQATTRGGRKMDGILNGKAEWKNTTGVIGASAMQAGLQQGGEAGMYMALAGALFAIGSSAMKTDADTRQWDSLPDGVALATASLAGEFVPTVVYTADTGPIALAPVPLMTAVAGKCTVVWTRSRSAVMDAETPGDDLKVRAAVARKKDVQVKDKLFRTALYTTFGS